MRLDDRIVIVTGGARGIGKVYALELAKEGAKVVVSDILGEGAMQTASEIQKNGGTALGIRTDITLEHEANKLAEEAVKAFGRIDVLVNNAGLYAGLKRRPFF